MDVMSDADLDEFISLIKGVPADKYRDNIASIIKGMSDLLMERLSPDELPKDMALIQFIADIVRNQPSVVLAARSQKFAEMYFKSYMLNSDITPMEEFFGDKLDEDLRRKIYAMEGSFEFKQVMYDAQSIVTKVVMKRAQSIKEFEQLEENLRLGSLNLTDEALYHQFTKTVEKAT